MIKINEEVVICPKCGSDWVSIGVVVKEELLIWCNECQEHIEDTVPLCNVTDVNITTKE